ncbi:MAG TPA: metallophosphoesterase [Methanosarcina sp.]|nr:metallophosphoesterase [Methanosarcina sp.]
MIAILGDTHFGARNGSKQYHRYFAKFFKDFFKYIDDFEIKDVIQLGDLFDVRKHVDTWVLDWCKETFIEECVSRKLNVYVCIGNHDIHYKETLEVNTPSLVLSEWPETFNVIDKPTETTIDGKKFLLVPWITKTNKDAIEAAIKKTKAHYLCGHFEFNGFPMHKGSIAKSHHEHEGYSKFKKIFSGHYHTKSTKDNVIYTGTPYETTWIDSGDEKGFYVLTDIDIVFAKNQHTFHEYITYPEVRNIESKFIRAIIEDTSDKKAIDKWKAKLIEFEPHDIKYTEKTQTTYASSMNMTKIHSTEDLIFDFVDKTETNLDKQRLKTMMHSLYQMAMGNQQ